MVRMCFRMALVAALCCAATGADTNGKSKAIAGWGEVADPDGDCKIRGDKQKVTITVPGTPHDLSKNFDKKNAPRLLREVEGDFSVQVRVSGEFAPGETSSQEGYVSFNGAGLLIWDNDKNYLRLERNRWYTPDGTDVQFPPLLEYWRDGEAAFAIPGSTQPFFKGRSTYLCLERRGAKIQAFVSHDGKEWLYARPITTEFPAKIKVGVAAINTSNRPFNVQFEDLQIKTGKDITQHKKDARPLPSAQSSASEVPPAILLFAAAYLTGSCQDVIDLIPPREYFKARGIEPTLERVMELASKEPVDPKTQAAQLLALRFLSTEAAQFKTTENVRNYRSVLEDIAAGKKAQDPQGFGREYAAQALAALDGRKMPAAKTPPLKKTLNWLPPTTAFVAAFDNRSMVRETGWDKVQEHSFAKLPADRKEEAFQLVESVGNMRLERMVVGYFAGEGALGFYRISGKINPKTFTALLRKMMPDAKIVKDHGASRDLLIFSFAGAETAIALAADSDLILVGKVDGVPRKKGRKLARRPDAGEEAQEPGPGKSSKLVEYVHKLLDARQEKTPRTLVHGLLRQIPNEAAGFVVAQAGPHFPIGAAGVALTKADGYVQGLVPHLVVRANFYLEDEKSAAQFLQLATVLKGQVRQGIENGLPGLAKDEHFTALVRHVFGDCFTCKQHGERVSLALQIPARELPSLEVRAFDGGVGFGVRYKKSDERGNDGKR